MPRKSGAPNEIERKEDIPEEDWTQGKANAADWIEEHVLAEDRWPMPYTDIAEESEWSRQHIANTIRDFFNDASVGQKEPTSEETISESVYVGDSNIRRITVEVPTDVENKESFIRGYVTAWKK